MVECGGRVAWRWNGILSDINGFTNFNEQIKHINSRICGREQVDTKLISVFTR